VRRSRGKTAAHIRLTKIDTASSGATVATIIAQKGKDVFVRELDAASSATSPWLV
jgi:hypothetical protein